MSTLKQLPLLITLSLSMSACVLQIGIEGGSELPPVIIETIPASGAPLTPTTPPQESTDEPLAPSPTATRHNDFPEQAQSSCPTTWFLAGEFPLCPDEQVKSFPAIVQPFEHGWIIRFVRREYTYDNVDAFVLVDTGQAFVKLNNIERDNGSFAITPPEAPPGLVAPHPELMWIWRLPQDPALMADHLGWGIRPAVEHTMAYQCGLRDGLTACLFTLPDGSIIFTEQEFSGGTSDERMTRDTGRWLQVLNPQVPYPIQPTIPPQPTPIPSGDQGDRPTGQIAFVQSVHLIPDDPSPSSYGCHLITAQADGSNLVDVTPNGVNCVVYPAYSPDGQQIAFLTGYIRNISAGMAEQLMVMDADGSDPRVLETRSFSNDAVIWSRDGTQIAVYYQGDFAWHVFDVEDGAELESLDTTPPANVWALPDVSPDGERRVESCNQSDAQPWVGDVCLVDAQGGVLENLTNNPDDYQMFTWSPDGEWITYNLENTIYALPVRGGSPISIAEGRQLTWRP